MVDLARRELQVKALLRLLIAVHPLPIRWLAYADLAQSLLENVNLLKANGPNDLLAKALVKNPDWIEIARRNPSFDRRFEQVLDRLCNCSPSDKHEGRLVFRDPDYELLDPREDILAYKIVHYASHPDGRDKWDDVMAVLHMQLPKTARIWTSDGPNAGTPVQVIPPFDGLCAGQKYNTNEAFVSAVQFCGKPAAVKRALLAYQRDQGFLVSGFGGANKMCYEIGRMHLEPRAGARVGGQGCTAGLHFFVDCASAFNYGNQKSDRLPYLVTRRISRHRGMVVVATKPPRDAIALPTDLQSSAAAYWAKRAGLSAEISKKLDDKFLQPMDSWLLLIK